MSPWLCRQQTREYRQHRKNRTVRHERPGQNRGDEELAPLRLPTPTILLTPYVHDLKSPCINHPAGYVAVSANSKATTSNASAAYTLVRAIDAYHLNPTLEARERRIRCASARGSNRKGAMVPGALRARRCADELRLLISLFAELVRTYARTRSDVAACRAAEAVPRLLSSADSLSVPS
ncbi:hypothetical protein DENSPDRAFT_317182 [Dentipellis sp. KUC8613]|nr:hypothetical protein DENSPDRAFT_317182 [Dentipellis sp. KUC8613]